jgi:short subunit dehydrogenase-like uncharacterized protein
MLATVVGNAHLRHRDRSPYAIISSMKSDLMLFGATGFTGRLVLAYLAKQALNKTGKAGGMSMVLAARNLDKLERVQRELGTSYPMRKVDASDAAGLLEATRSTRVVCTTVGPYALHGGPLANACARSGTHYCDLTGEVTFMRRSIDENHALAKASGAKIVHACGFDSIPSDLGVWMLAEEARKVHHATLGKTELFAGPMRGAISGGTLASALEIMREARTDQAVRKLLANPYALSPDSEQEPRLDKNETARVREVKDEHGKSGLVASLFVMAGCNTRVVRRSNALLGYAYGREFRYSEEQIFGRGLKGKATAYAFLGGLSLLLASQTNKITRSAAAKLLPKAGEGPSAEQQAKGFFTLRIESELAGSSGTLTARVRGDGDPGYAATAVMLGESALCLASDVPSPSLSSQGEASEGSGGVLTPASAMAEPLLARLKKAGMSFEVAGR